jgi:hypothetical protein
MQLGAKYTEEMHVMNTGTHMKCGSLQSQENLSVGVKETVQYHSAEKLSKFSRKFA